MGDAVTVLTPAQVRNHARALMLGHVLDVAGPMAIGEYLDWLPEHERLPDADYEAAILAIDDAIRTARITVDWDEETPC